MVKSILLNCLIILSFFNLGLQAEEIPLTSEYRVDTMWATAYQVTVKLTNQTNQPTESWTASFTIPPENVLSGHVSGGEFSSSGQNITVKNTSANGIIPASGSVSFNLIINMPLGGKTTINQLAAMGYSSVAPPSNGLSAPILNPISSTSSNSYTISWTKVTNATKYFLEVDNNGNFTNPKLVLQENVNSVDLTNQPIGTYFYRVAAGNDSSKSQYSNIQSITVAGQNSVVPLLSSYKIDTVWATAFQATVTLTNNTSVPVNKWTATFVMPNGCSLSSHVSGGIFSVSGQKVTVKNATTNGTIAPNSSVTFNMIIVKPANLKSQINSLQASGNVDSIPPNLPIPAAPVLTLASTSDSSYTVSWTSQEYASSYTLQEDTEANFPQPKVIVQGNVLTQSFINKPSGTYFYRVFATNASGQSPSSNIGTITVTNTTPIPPTDTIEYSEWYIDWTSWFDGPPFVIPKNANMLNIFVGELTYGADGKPTMGGFGTFTIPQMQAFVKYLAQQNPPMQAKVSIGGAGGMYDRTWDKLTSANIQAFAQGMVDFCHNVGLAGVDFDYEAFVSPEQEALVGSLIKAFKTIDPKLQTSICSNAGFGPNFPWQAAMKNVLDAAMISPGNCAVDRFYIMSYYNSMSEEIGWIVGADGKGGWANWLITTYGFTRARISVGIDDYDAHAYDPVAFKAWAISEGFSVAHWAFDPARPN